MFSFFKQYLKRAREEAAKGYAFEPVGDRDDNDQSGRGQGAWIGIDLDGTLAVQGNRTGLDTVGEPVPAMMDLLNEIIGNGMRVKIFTARASDPDQVILIRNWLKVNQLPDLEITNIKDYRMIRLYDDRAIQVEKNTGRLVMDK